MVLRCSERAPPFPHRRTEVILVPTPPRQLAEVLSLEHELHLLGTLVYWLILFQQFMYVHFFSRSLVREAAETLVTTFAGTVSLRFAPTIVGGV